MLFEVVGDMQLLAHKRDPAKKGTYCMSGLRKYTRHPQYFGEAVIWWGIYTIACGVEGGVYTVYSAALITFLVRFISGVEMLERKSRKRPEFRVYMLETNAFIPWVHRPVKPEMREKLLSELEAEMKSKI